MNFRETVKLSHFEGALFALMFASTESFLNYYAVRQNISALQLAILSTVPLLFGAFAQIIIPYFVSEKNLGNSIVWTMLIQVIGLLGILYTVYQKFDFFNLLLYACIYFIGGQASTPLWIDWVSRIIPKRNFRKYISNRNEFTWYLILGFYISFALLAEFTSWFKIITIFIIGAMARIISCSIQYFLIRKPQPIRMIHQHHFKDKTALDNNTKKLLFSFIYLTAFFRVAIMMSGPFFIPYMINDLKLSMTGFVILSSIPFFGRAIFFTRWGRSGGQYFAFWGVIISALYISTIPILWTFTQNLYVLIAIEILSGIAWGGLELNQVLMIQNFVHHKSRLYLGGHMALSNLMAVLGAIFGSYLMNRHVSYFNMFRLSSLLRFSVVIVLFVTAKYCMPLKFRMNSCSTYLKSILSCH